MFSEQVWASFGHPCFCRSSKKRPVKRTKLGGIEEKYFGVATPATHRLFLKTWSHSVRLSKILFFLATWRLRPSRPLNNLLVLLEFATCYKRPIGKLDHYLPFDSSLSSKYCISKATASLSLLCGEFSLFVQFYRCEIRDHHKL